MAFRSLYKLLRKTFSVWNTSRVKRLAGALAYYAAFSLIALLVVTAFAGNIVLQETNVRSELVRGIEEVIGESNSEVIRNALSTASQDIRNSSTLASVGTLLMLLYSSSGLFRRLEDALNVLWNAQKPTSSNDIKRFALNTLEAVVAAVLFGTLLLLVLLTNGVAFAMINLLDQLLPGETTVVLWQVAGFSLLFLVTMVLFALIFRFIPNKQLDWGSIWVGALVTAALFTVGQFVIAFYIDITNTGTVYGAVGAFTVILLWVYASAHIILFGAIFTYQHAQQIKDAE